MRDIFLDPRKFVRYWFMDLQRFKMKPNGHFVGSEPNNFATLWLDYKEVFKVEVANDKEKFDPETGKPKKSKFTRLAEKDLEYAWSEFLTIAQRDARQELIASLTFVKEDDSQLTKWLTATVGPCSPFQIAALKHTIWQVKRKMFGKKVVYHLSPAFWGSQGAGKTEAIKKLIEPMTSLCLEWGLSEAVDPRNTQTLAENYICIFDEMAGLQKVEIEALKRVISTEYSSYRPLHTNRMLKVPQNCTFIGISNKSLVENIFDPTGLRRFVEFTCLQQIDWDAINSVDAVAMWRSIDENVERGYLEGFSKEMKTHQQDMIVLDEMQQYISDNKIVPEEGPVKEIICNTLYQTYTMWRAANNYTGFGPLSPTMFYRKLRSFGIQKRTRTAKGDDKVVYLINPEASIFKSDDTNRIPIKRLEFNQ